MTSTISSFLRKTLKINILILALLIFPAVTFAQHESHKDTTQQTAENNFEKEHAATDEEFNFSEMIMHHITDSHEWHFATIGHTHLTIPLPVILYSSDRGLEIFLSSRFHSQGELSEGEKAEHSYKGYIIDEESHKIVSLEGRTIYDFSITKNVASMFISLTLLCVIFISIANRYKDNKDKAPKGIQSLFEPIIIFLRDDVIKTNIPGKDHHGREKYEKFLPYLLTLFFFIWFNNLLGLLPGGANLTGNISVTFVLAILTLILTLFNSRKYYWKHIFAAPGVPTWLLPIMIPVELLGIFTKPFALMVRLFANVTGGHIVILSFVGLIFLFKSIFVSPASIVFVIAMNFLELLVAFLQAYIFTLLTSMYIGGAVEEHDHSHD